MEVIRVKDYQELSEVAAAIFIKQVKEKPNTTLGLATGGSPTLMYELLVKDYQDNQTDYSDVVSFNLDEYLNLEQNHPETYYTFMHKNLFDHINIKEENIYIPNGAALDVQVEADNYEKLLDNHQIDLQLLGIGTNGHIGFNEPNSSFDGLTSVVDLTEETILANSRFFDNNLELVPKQAISMGIASILKAKKIVLIASGASKAEAIKAMVDGKLDEKVPASALLKHDNVILIVDSEAGKLLD